MEDELVSRITYEVYYEGLRRQINLDHSIQIYNRKCFKIKHQEAC